MEGILITKNYQDFTIENAAGTVLASFSGAAAASHAMPYDIVSYNGTNCRLLKSRYSPLRLIGTLELTSKMTYGLTSRNTPLYLFRPEDPSYPFFVVGSTIKDRTANRRVLIEYESWTDYLPRGIIIQTYSETGDYATEKIVIEKSAAIPESKKSVEISTTPLLPPSIEKIPQNTFICNIDPDGCEDIDDAIGFLQLTDTTLQCYILISAPATFVLPSSPLDILASLRSSTLYNETGSVLHPMLPEELSTNRASLKADGMYRPVIAWKFTINTETYTIENDGGLNLMLAANGISYTYDNVVERAQPSVIAKFEALSAALGYPSTDPHKWIEAAMISYNARFAHWLFQKGTGVLRAHKGTDLERYNKYAAAAAATEAASALLKYAIESARYVPTDSPNPIHAGLGIALYTQASSPLRRYADLHNQQVFLHAHYPTIYSVTPAHFDCPFHNKRQRALKAYKRNIIFLEYMENQENKWVEALIIDKPASDKVRIWIKEWDAIMSWKNPPEDYAVGMTIPRLGYYYNKNAHGWKNKFLFRPL